MGRGHSAAIEGWAMTDYLGWVGNVLLLTGAYFIGYRHRHAFLLIILGEAIWCVPSFMTERYDMLFICIFAMGMAMRNWWMWRQSSSELSVVSCQPADAEQEEKV